MGREFELKYWATPEQLQLLRAELALDWQSISMETVYYDTPAGDVSRRKWTLRRRYENGLSVCTLKTPLPDGSRGEWEVECGDIRSAISMLCKLGAPEELLSLDAEALQPACGARFTRLAASVTCDGCTLELALDSGVLLGGGREIPLCEMEAELKSGSENAALAYAEALQSRYHLIPEPRSKYARASRLAKGE